MKQNKSFFVRLAIGVSIILMCFSVFLYQHKSDFVDQRFHQFDEMVNGTVTTNLARDIFPPVLRIQPLIKEYAIWTEGPEWQHIPPAYMYVPVIFSKITGAEVTDIKIHRLAYGLIWLIGIIVFLIAIVRFSDSKNVYIAALVTMVIVLITPFTQGLILGNVFNNSDIVLFSVSMLAFLALLTYIKQVYIHKNALGIVRLILISTAVTLPIIVKHMLGAIPLTAILCIAIWYHRSFFHKDVFIVFCVAVIEICLAYVPLYISNPHVFLLEIFTPIYHLGPYEGFIKPWHAFITEHIPNVYLGDWYLIGYIIFILGVHAFFIRKYEVSKEIKILLSVSFGWFIWNLLVISLAITKSPNFIYQSYIFFIFFIMCTAIIFLSKMCRGWKMYIWGTTVDISYRWSVLLLSISILTLIISICMVYNHDRISTFSTPIKTVDHYFYETGQFLRYQGVTEEDLVLLYNSTQDCVRFKYNIIFNTGAESDSLYRFIESGLTGIDLRRMYRDVYLIINQNSNINTMDVPFAHEKLYFNMFTILKIHHVDIDSNLRQQILEFRRNIDYDLPMCNSSVFDILGKISTTTAQ